MTVLDKLYKWYEMENPNYPGDAGVRDRFCDVWESAEKVVGEELLEKLRSSMFDYMEEECRNDFQAGFRMGAQLMLELCLPGGGEQSV